MMATGHLVKKRTGQTSNPLATSGRQKTSKEDESKRKQIAIRRMEKSSTNSLKTLNESYSLGVETIQHLDRQARTLHRFERRQDRMKEDLDEIKQTVLPVESLFDRIINFFSRRRSVTEVTVPKRYSAAALSGPKRNSARLRHYSHTDGSKMLDDNMDKMSRQLDRLEGVGMATSKQLDDSEIQTSRIAPKVSRNEKCIKQLHREMKRV